MLNRLTVRVATFPIVLGLLMLVPGTRAAQDGNSALSAKTSSEPRTVKLTIQVTGGEEKTPVDSASVYVRFVEVHKIGKDKHIEMNLKTNLSGLCHVPEIPAGKVIIQVIAPGWKTFGQTYDLDPSDRNIDISLARPPKWY